MKCAILFFLGLGLATPARSSTTARAKSARKKCEAATKRTMCGLRVMESTAECDKKKGLKTTYTGCDDGNEDHFLFVKQEGGECFDACSKPETFCRLSFDLEGEGGWVYGQLIKGCCVSFD